MKFVKIILATLVALVSFSASAVTYDSSDACQAAQRANKAEQYHPTMRSAGFNNPNRLKGLKKADSEADGCYLMDTAVGRKWVFLKAGTGLFTEESKPTLLAECQNKIYDVVFLQQGDASPRSCPGGCEDTVTKHVKVVTVIEEVRLCKRSNGSTYSPKAEEGCEFGQFNASTSVKAEVKVEPPTTCTSGCSPKVNPDRRVERTDSRCIVAFKGSSGDNRFVRFDLRSGTNLLVAGRVTDEKGDTWDKSIKPTYVGDGNGTVRMSLPANCEDVFRAITSSAVFNWTAPKLGLENCTVVGRV